VLYSKPTRVGFSAVVLDFHLAPAPGIEKKKDILFDLLFFFLQ